MFRISKRYYLEVFNKKALGKPTLIVANNERAEEITRTLLKNSIDYWPVVILNDETKGSKINGIDILNFEQIQDIYDGLEVAIISEEYDIKNWYKKLKKLNIKQIKQYHKIKDIKKELKDITVEDLLARHPKDLDKTAIKKFIKDKIILVTGAGGSIGSEIVRQCLGYGAKKIIALDHSEYNLYKIVDE